MTTLSKNQNRKNGLQTLYNPLDRFFRNDFIDLWDKASPMTVPGINISEGKSSYKIEMAAPGLKKEDINVEADGNMLTISCEKESERSDGSPEKDDEHTYSRREYNYSSFSRSFTIPENADGENIKAKYENGVVRIDLPKKKENLKGGKQKISID
jgi:HSP20 family protein